MQRQSGTSDLRALLYMDEIAGYLPPTAVPPTKKPILTLMKQARAFGVGVVLATQNPVDLDYRALSNAGTWMIGRLQTEQDVNRLVDGMSAAAGSVDLGAVRSTIAGLGKRTFVLRRAGADAPSTFTTRWAMSYLRGPLTRDQISTLTAPQRAEVAERATVGGPPVPGAAAGALPLPADGAGVPDDASAAMPAVAEGIPVRWVDPAAPWLRAVGADPASNVLQAAIVARVALRYDEARADLVHDEEYELVLVPLTDPLDAAAAVAVDHDDRDLRDAPPAGCRYLSPAAPIGRRTFWTSTRTALVAHLVRSRRIELLVHRELKLWSRPGETADSFRNRCAELAGMRAGEQVAALRDRYEGKVGAIRRQLASAESRAEVARSEASGRRSEELLSTAGSILGGLLGGRRSRGGLLGSAGRAAGGRRRAATADRRADAAQERIEALHDQLADLEAELSAEIAEIDARWRAAAVAVEAVPVGLERDDVTVTHLVLAWLPVAGSPAAAPAPGTARP